MSTAFLNDRRELKLVLEVADIVDELKMIQHLFKKQEEVLSSLKVALGNSKAQKDSHTSERSSENAPSHVILDDAPNLSVADHNLDSASELLGTLLNEIDIIKKDAEYTHQMVRTRALNLLNKS